jgi:hypothetical protein
MERKHFVTSAQTVLSRIILMTTKKEKDKKYGYYMIKLPATFKGQTVTWWADSKGYGGKTVPSELGGSCMIRFSAEDIEKLKLKLGDTMVATFKDKDAELD